MYSVLYHTGVTETCLSLEISETNLITLEHYHIVTLQHCCTAREAISKVRIS